MRHFIALAVMLLLAPGCSSDPPVTIPAAAAAMDAKLKANMVRFLPMVASIESTLVFVLNPGTPMAQGVVVQPDPAIPNSITFGGPYDSDGDGVDETTMSGGVTFNSDPDVSWSGLTGHVTVDGNIPVVGQVYHAAVAFTVSTTERRLSGSGTFRDPLSGDATTTMTVEAATPLVVKPATGAAGAVSNACGYSLDGKMRLSVVGSTGTLTSIWNFSSSSAGAQISGASFTDPLGQTTALPAATADLRCGSSGSINDWVATFDQNYACLPRESGQSTITTTVAGPDSITIRDEDPPGSGSVKTYQATIISANPHAMRGFFEGGPVGGRYREDFNWTLGGTGSRFSQISSYAYSAGPNTGSGGFCVASGKRR